MNESITLKALTKAEGVRIAFFMYAHPIDDTDLSSWNWFIQTHK